MAKWQDKLTRAELKHVKETTTRNTLGEIKTNIKQHEKWRAEKTRITEPCWICKEIGRKLGLVAA